MELHLKLHLSNQVIHIKTNSNQTIYTNKKKKRYKKGEPRKIREDMVENGKKQKEIGRNRE